MKDFAVYKPWLDKMAGSKYFTSGNDLRLLKYLIKATLNGNTIKETIIATDVFGRDATYDPGSDSIVRSNIYNLRKKLESYYRDEGATDAIRFEIPKGSYHVQFILTGNEVQQIGSRKKMFVSGIAILLIVVSAFVAYFLIDSTKTDSGSGIKNNPVLTGFLNPENPLLIVLGDYFMMEKIEFPDSSFNFVRDPKINNQADFLEYLENNPVQKKNLRKMGQTYFGGEIPVCYSQLLRVFNGTAKQVNIKYASELSLNDIKQNDIVFVGDFATLGILKPFLEKNGLRFSVFPSSVSVLNEKHETIEFYLLDNPAQSVFQNDFALVSRVSGYEGKKILFYLSFLPFGKSEAIIKLTDQTFLNELKAILPEIPEQWNLLLKVSGLQSAGFDHEILSFKEVK